MITNQVVMSRREVSEEVMISRLDPNQESGSLSSSSQMFRGNDMMNIILKGCVLIYVYNHIHNLTLRSSILNRLLTTTTPRLTKHRDDYDDEFYIF